ncbi:MAG: hypothetical protein JW801_10905 [Bacteroidales bacterium]|nr:hypothetical protein [Bacteroidales bacterium]
MDIKVLKQRVLVAYSVENLNRLSVTLIGLYKDQQFSRLRRIAEMLEGIIQIEIDDKGKGFSKLMMLYHPDKGDFHRSEIERLAGENNFDGLLWYSHILKLERIDEMVLAYESLEDIDYSPVYEWDFDAEGFRVENPEGEDSEPVKERNAGSRGVSFYDAIKIRHFGNTQTEYPTYYLEDIEEFELASSEINSLEGVEYCVHAKIMDLSDNGIFDLEPLAYCRNMEELNLSGNEIGYIDALSNLVNLRSLSLDDNEIRDISPLFGLEKLEFVSIAGNRVDPRQIRELAGSGVTVAGVEVS